ncbi:MAG: queuosine precursor transporter [Nitratireductor sp.]
MSKSYLSVLPFIFAMALVVVLSNILVNFPVGYSLGSVFLGDLLTYGAFTYPFAFLVTDLTNRVFGTQKARRVVAIGFLTAVIASIVVPQILYAMGLIPVEYQASIERLTRIAISSGTAFLVAQILDIFVFDQMRDAKWWKAPLISSLVGSFFDTCLFFTLAFSTSFAFLGENDAFALESAPFLAVFAAMYPRWISWAVGDFLVKVIVGVVALAPYKLLLNRIGAISAKA